MLAMVSMMPMARPDTAMAIASTRTFVHRGMMANITEMMRADTNRADKALKSLKGGERQLCKLHLRGPSSQINPAGRRNTDVLLKTPPIELPINRQNCWEKNTHVIWLRVEFV